MRADTAVARALAGQQRFQLGTVFRRALENLIPACIGSHAEILLYVRIRELDCFDSRFVLALPLQFVLDHGFVVQIVDPSAILFEQILLRLI